MINWAKIQAIITRVGFLGEIAHTRRAEDVPPEKVWWPEQLLQLQLPVMPKLNLDMVLNPFSPMHTQRDTYRATGKHLVIQVPEFPNSESVTLYEYKFVS